MTDNIKYRWNQYFNRIRCALNLTPQEIIEIFAAAGDTVTKAKITDWARNHNSPHFRRMPRTAFETFLLGFQLWCRGNIEIEDV